ncbi:hypothetical protein RN001_003127 [Aquatica leii]|uniref:SWIM-type domain-containing protein n=1 Tax=Aquatica leii TaxID=1421715 RepID=A0AAN7PN92_9COLE|nr:hypothetical protein RN001_003127 [Aquatica leii]
MECRFSVCDYFMYIKGTENSRVVYEGKEVLNAGHVILCGTTHRSEDTINVYALCLQTSALQSPPHKIDGIFYFHDKKWDIKSFICSCKGGNSGRCKHILAVLLSCTSPFRKQISLVLGQRRRAMTQQKYRPVPIAEMECIKKIVAYDVNNDIFTKIYDNLITSLPNSALALRKTGRNNVVENEVDIVEYIFEDKSIETEMLLILNHTTQSILMMELAHHQIQFVDSCCQDLYKKKFSKNVSIILRQDWARKSNRYFYPKGFSNKFTEHGLKYEEIALKVFMNTTGLSVVNCGATNTLGNVLKKIDYVQFKENTYCLKERHKYYAQVQLGMAMLNVQNCKFIIFCSFDSSMAIIDVPFNYEYIKSITFIVKEKYYKNMLHDICEIEKH